MTNANRKILHELITELQSEGVYSLKDLAHLSEGYKSKMLHVITHLIDGFFGIDSFFYNLIASSSAIGAQRYLSHRGVIIKGRRFAR